MINHRVIRTSFTELHRVFTFHFPLSTFHFSLSTLHSSLFTFHFPLFNLHFPHSTLHFSLSTLHFSLSTIIYSLLPIHYYLSTTSTLTLSSFDLLLLVLKRGTLLRALYSYLFAMVGLQQYDQQYMMAQLS